MENTKKMIKFAKSLKAKFAQTKTKSEPDVGNAGAYQISDTLGFPNNAPGFDKETKTEVQNIIVNAEIFGKIENKITVFKGAKGSVKKVKISTYVDGKLNSKASNLLAGYSKRFGEKLKDLNIIDDSITVQWINFAISAG